jgi:hypothetical protein
MPNIISSAATGRLKRPWTDTWNVRRPHSRGPPGQVAAAVVGTPRTEIWGGGRTAAGGRVLGRCVRGGAAGCASARWRLRAACGGARRQRSRC